MTEELTAVEQAAEKARKAGLAEEMKQMDDVELAMLAKRAGVDAALHPKREALVAAIELKATKDAAEGRRALREEDDRQKKFVGEQDAQRTPFARALCALNAEFSGSVPQPVRMFKMPEDDDYVPTKTDLALVGHWVGSYPTGGDLRFAREFATKDGKYRVSGSPFVFEIRGKRVVTVHAANPGNDFCGHGVIAVE